MFFDPTYFYMVLIPGLLLSGLASFFTKSTFKKYSRVPARSQVSGAEAAQRLLRDSGITDVSIEPVQGFLSDHYDPRHKVLRLSPDVYGGRSLSAIGVACHEAGHAIQDAAGYAPMRWRSAMVPMTTLSSNLAMPLIFAGFLLNTQPLIGIGAILFATAVVFAIVTLPVEWDATARAKQHMVTAGIVSNDEARHAGAVLNAAFLTYLASALTALLTLLYYLMRAGLLGGSRD